MYSVGVLISLGDDPILEEFRSHAIGLEYAMVTYFVKVFTDFAIVIDPSRLRASRIVVGQRSAEFFSHQPGE